MLAFFAAVIGTFIGLPHLEAALAPFFAAYVLDPYGVQHGNLLRVLWRIFLACTLFAVIRGALALVFSAAALALAMRILSGRGR